MSGQELQSPVLLVQCCHLPQFFFIARLLRQKNPDIEIHALVVDHPHERQYLELFEKFAKVHFAPTPRLQEYSDIIFPLLNRGYRGLKRRAWKMPGRRWECDYEGQLLPLSRGRLIRSYLTPPHPADSHFVEFLNDFPHRPLAEEILILNSAHESLQEQYDQPLKELPAQAGTITRLDPSSFWKAWRSVRGKSFDGAVVFFSGERGRFHLKLLPFLKRIPRVVIFNENRSYFDADWRGLARFWFQRLRHGVVLPKRIPSILLLQSEVKEYVAGAAKNLRLGHLYPEARITVLCKEEDWDYLGKIPEINEAIPYTRQNQLRKTYQAIRELKPDIVAAVFSGRPLYRASKLLFLGMVNRPRLVVNAQLDCYRLSVRTLFRLRERGTLLRGLKMEVATKVVVVQTEGLPYLQEVVKRVRGPKFYPESEVVVLARAQDAQRVAGISGVDQVIPWSPQDRFFSLRRRIKKLRPEAVFATFTGRPGHRRQKLFFMLFRGTPRGVFNPRLDAYWLSLKTVGNLFRSEPPLFAEEERRRTVVLLQTESWRNVAAAAERLGSKKLFPRAEVVVFCKQQDADRLEACSAISRVMVYSRSNPAGLRHDLKEIRRLQPDAITAIFSNPRSFPAAKTLFMLSRSASKLVFNGRLDCFWLGLRTMPQLLRREPVMFDAAGERVSDILLIQTEDRRMTTRALERTVREKAVNAEQVAVFCSRQEADHFEQHPLVDRVFSYGKGDWKETLSVLRKLRRERWDVVVGLFTGRPIFRLQKLLFLFLPARQRLVFNPSLDYLYLKRSRVARTLRLPSLLVPRQGDSGAFNEALRKLARGTMFLPRFAYLMAWLSIVKLKRARGQGR